MHKLKNSPLHFLLISLLLMIIVFLPQTHATGPSDYNKRIEITVNDSTSNLTDYQVLIDNLTYQTDMENDFSLIAFYDNSSNLLSHYCPYVDEGNYARCFVKMNVTANENNSIYAYYDNNTAVQEFSTTDTCDSFKSMDSTSGWYSETGCSGGDSHAYVNDKDYVEGSGSVNISGNPGCVMWVNTGVSTQDTRISYWEKYVDYDSTNVAFYLQKDEHNSFSDYGLRLIWHYDTTRISYYGTSETYTNIYEPGDEWRYKLLSSEYNSGNNYETITDVYTLNNTATTYPHKYSDTDHERFGYSTDASDGYVLVDEWCRVQYDADNDPTTTLGTAEDVSSSSYVNITNITINNETTPTINPVEATDLTLNITFIATHSSNASDLNLTTAYAKDYTDTIENTSCSWGSFSNSTSKSVNCELTLPYHTTGGSKTIGTFIGNTASDQQNTTFTLNTIYVISLNISTLDFGNLNTETNNNQATLQINNTGNGNLNISIKASDFTSGENTLEIGNCTLDDDATPGEAEETSKNELTLTSSAQDYTPSDYLTTNSVLDWWFNLDVPILPTGEYSSTSNWEISSSQAN